MNTPSFLPLVRSSRVVAVTAGLGMAGGALLLGGCYEHVVAARGPGTENIQIQEPYQDTWLDKQVWGDSTPSNNINSQPKR